jgi:predicted ATP-grasp superfamily ATP-dependent carboligase
MASSPSSHAAYRVEQFCPGEPVSVALLRGPAGQSALPPCRQRLSDDGRFQYLGGSLPLPPPLAYRATRLAERAVAALPNTLGYVGVDLVLGAETDGAGDFVIEVNPRLTTSYIGLRAASRENLAAALLEVAEGRVPRLSFAADRVEFNAIGQVRVCAPAPSAR